MKKKNWVILVAAIILLLTGVIFHNEYKVSKIDESNIERQQAIEDVLQKSNITINTKYQYRNGTHTFLGTFETPTPCYTYNVEKKETDGIKEIAITYQEMHDETGEAMNCTQVITERDFKVSFEGSVDDEIIATINGDLVNLNIFEVSEDEDIEDVEVYMKG